MEKVGAKEMARFDTKIPKETKQLFERAAQLGGYRTLTEFIISSAKDKANEIVKEQDNFLASENDRAVFFNAIIKSEEPNKKLQAAATRYKKEVSGL